MPKRSASRESNLDRVSNPVKVSSSTQHFNDWFDGRGWSPFPFQEEMLAHYLEGKSGLLNAPTGSGKTLAMWLPILMDWIQKNPDYKTKEKNGLKVLWISPLRALAKDAASSMQEACIELELPWRVELRTGDTSTSVRARQKKNMPECLVTTPESLHVLISNKNHAKYFKGLQVLVVDEWHDLLGTKRGVQVELASAHLKTISPDFRVWGISATIGNMQEALEVLLGADAKGQQATIVRANLDKQIEVTSVLPEEIETFPWSGHLGIHMVHQVTPLVEESDSTLLFCNTRKQAELWYQTLLTERPHWAGIMALHHGSLSQETRTWVEEALHEGRLKLVVCTASLDLGVDFRPVDTVIQIGGPKGVARFMQRAGRSGHQPGAISRIFFVPTHSLELVEAAALRKAVDDKLIEERPPIILAYDTLIQYLVTLAVGDGFLPEKALEEVKTTFSYAHLQREEWNWILEFITTGGKSLQAYEEYQKVEIDEDGYFRVNKRGIATRHRLSMGTIVSDTSLKVKFLSGGYLGTIEESFIATLSPNDHFWFAGRPLELVRVRNNEVFVRRSRRKTSKMPNWNGSRMPLSSQMATIIRQQLDDYAKGNSKSVELQHLKPLFNLQKAWSHIPQEDLFLIERLKTREGFHLCLYPFEGRVLHEMLGALFAYRISRIQPITFSIAMNDYGLELTSDQEVPLEAAIEAGLFSTENLAADLERSVNETIMALKKFYEIARISGLTFAGFPGRPNTNKHLHATSALIFKVFKEYDPQNLLLRQAYSEVIDYQVDDARLRAALDRITHQKLAITDLKQASPFAFQLLVEQLRGRLTVSSEKLSDRIAKMQVPLRRAAAKVGG
ncbi:MAG: ligase-associated DNA damage response DEXH box helicase [Bacteroidota bacterium]